MKLVPHRYQNAACEFMFKNKNGALFLDMGMGKTLITLLFVNMLRILGRLHKPVLVVAPLRVAHLVWPVEAAKWFPDLKVTVLHATSSSGRSRADKLTDILKRPSHVYVTTPEVLSWLHLQNVEFSVLVVDESTKFKNQSSKRFKQLRSMLPLFERRYILTGTPVPNGYEDLWAQMYIVDQGESLGKNITAFRAKYMYKFRHPAGFYDHKMQPDGEARILEAVKTKTLRLAAEDYLDLPELNEVDVWINLPGKVMEAYKELEFKYLFELEGLKKVTLSAASKYGSLRQIANGGLYDDNKVAGFVHDAKVKHARKLLSDKPTMICYQFIHDLHRLQAEFGSDTPYLGGGVSVKKTKALEESWNCSEVELMLCQPAAMGHGLNLQKAGDTQIWMGLPDDYDHYKQTVARIYRQGASTDKVNVFRILAKDTVDEISKVRNGRKKTCQDGLLDDLREYKQNVAT